MGSLLCFSCSYVPYYLFYRVNSATYFLLPLVEAIATLCFDAYFYVFLSSPSKPPPPKQVLETQSCRTPSSPFHSDWETLQVKSKPGSCRVRNISPVLFLPSAGVLFASSVPLPFTYLTLTPNVAAFHPSTCLPTTFSWVLPLPIAFQLANLLLI